MTRRSMLSLFILIMIIGIIPAGMAAEFNKVKPEEINAKFDDPKLIKQVKPERYFYTGSREVEGYVTLELTVNTEGVVESARVIYKTSNLAVNNAIDAVAEWEFTPAKLDGMPVRSLVCYSLPFGRNLEILEDRKYEKKLLLDDETLAMYSNR